MDIKIVTWNGYEIRFVQHKGEWWAMATDLMNLFGYVDPQSIFDKIAPDDHIKYNLTQGDDINGFSSIINEMGLYRLLMSSSKEEMEIISRWTLEIIKEVRQGSGLEIFNIFDMLDRNYMDNL